MRVQIIVGFSAVAVLGGAALASAFVETDARAVQPTETATGIQRPMSSCMTGSDVAVRGHVTVVAQPGSITCDAPPVVALPNFGHTRLSFRWR